MRRQTTLFALMAVVVGVAVALWTWRGEVPAPSGERGVSTTLPAHTSTPPALAGRRAQVAREGDEASPSEHDKRDMSDEVMSSSEPYDDLDPWGGGSIVSGRVVDLQGRPLGGIPVYAALATPKGYVLSDQRLLWLDGPDADGGRATARKYGGAGVTDAAGEFRVDVSFVRLISSWGGRVRVVPSHPAWMEPRIVTGEEGGEIRAEPSASLSVRVVDESGVAVPEFRAVVGEAGRGAEQEIAATDGGFVVQWRRREGVPDEIRASVTIWARGRAMENREVTIPADRDADSVTFALGPVLQDGHFDLRQPATTETDAVRGVVVVLALARRVRVR